MSWKSWWALVLRTFWGAQRFSGRTGPLTPRGNWSLNFWKPPSREGKLPCPAIGKRLNKVMPSLTPPPRPAGLYTPKEVQASSLWVWDILGRYVASGTLWGPSPRIHTWPHLPGATGLIFKSSSPKRDRKEKGASAAGGSFSPMVTISGPLGFGSACATASFASKNRKPLLPYLQL